MLLFSEWATETEIPISPICIIKIHHIFVSYIIWIWAIRNKRRKKGGWFKPHKTYLDGFVVHDQQILRFDVFMDDILLVQDGESLPHTFAYGPNLALLYLLLLYFRLFDKVIQHVSFPRILHQNAKVKRSIRILFKKAVIWFDKVFTGQLLKEESLFHCLLFLQDGYIWSHKYLFKG